MSDPIGHTALNTSVDHKRLKGEVEVDEQRSQFEGWSDLQLWRAFKNGNRAAFIYIYNEYFDKLYAYGFQFSKDEALVKDCIQDMFIEINQSKNRLSDTTSIQLYLYKIIKRKILNFLKYRKNTLLTLNSYQGLNFAFEISEEQKIIDQQITSELKSQVNQAINNLNTKQREAIFYFYFEEFSMEQIKELLDFKNVKSVQNLIYKALRELRSALTAVAFLWFVNMLYSIL